MIKTELPLDKLENTLNKSDVNQVNSNSIGYLWVNLLYL